MKKIKKRKKYYEGYWQGWIDAIEHFLSETRDIHTEDGDFKVVYRELLIGALMRVLINKNGDDK